MTPADAAMKAALDESARYADSPPATTSALQPLLGRTSHPNLTSLGPHFGKTSDHVDNLDRPATPHISLHQFHKLQHSPVTSSPDIGYKRVRRKQSYTSLARVPSEENRSPARHTSSSVSLHSRRSKSLLPSLLPPLPPTQLSQSSTYSPSLSSTVDTLQSTPTHSPIQRVLWPPDQWGGIELGGRSEPIRTKRKFLPLKQAKRLPHHTAHHVEGESVWEVHAAVIDVGLEAGELDELGGGEEAQAERRYEAAQLGSPAPGSDERADRRKGRIVRFEDSQLEESGNEASGSSSADWPLRTSARAPTLSSPFSLSKFQFPAPPGSNWDGTFGHLTEPNSPASPATLHYRGVSFDVVNPHTSLLLGVSNIETPGEIDGLLDNYFDRNKLIMEPDNEEEGRQRATSQYSLQTSSSNGRQRILYDDPDSARRNIMGIQGSGSRQTVMRSPSQGRESDIPPLPSHAPPAIPLPIPLIAPRPRTPPRIIRLHPKFTEVLGLGTDEGNSRVAGYDRDYEELGSPPAEPHYTTASTQQSDCGPALADAPRTDDRPNSLYPHSRRSYPFDLTLDYEEEDLAYSNTRDVATSRFASAGRTDQGTDFAIYEDDADDANATQSTETQETTVGQILSHYTYPRPAVDAQGYFIPRHQDPSTLSSSIGYARGEQFASNNPFASPEDATVPYTDFGLPNYSTPTFETSTPQELTYGGIRRGSRIRSPPNRPPPPTPQNRPTFGTGSNPYALDPVATEQTYGSTGQLLQLSPQGGSYATLGYEFRAPPAPGRRRQRADHDFEDVPLAQAAARPTEVPPPLEEGDEDKENTPPQPARPRSTLSVTPVREPTPVYQLGPRRLVGPATIVDLPGHMQGSPMVHDDDESTWESTQASESRENLAGAGQDREMDQFEDVRPSDDSYANTSIAGSNNRLSMPQPDAPIPPTSIRRVWPSTTSDTLSSPSAHGTSFRPRARTANDEERARRILEEKMVEDAVIGEAQGDFGHTRRTAMHYASNMRDLEEIRQRNPSAVEKAVKAVSEGIGKLALIQPISTPEASASRMAPFAFGRNTPDSRYSETRGLLAEHAGSPYSNRGLRFSETANTFQTTRQMPSFVTSPPIQGYSPLSPPSITPPVPAYVRNNSNTPTGRHFRAVGRRPPSKTLASASETYEMQPMSTRRGRVSKAAMSSQTELRPLALAESTMASGITGGRLTDLQLAGAEGTWTMRPGQSSNHTAVNTHVPLILRGANDSETNVNQLIGAQDARSMPMRRIQRYLTRPYFRVCALCPLTALLFGLGGLDWRMRQMTNGRIQQMSRTAKKQALQVYLPLGLIIYAAVGVTIGLFAYMIANDMFSH